MGRALRSVHGCDEGVSALEEAHRTGSYYCPMSVVVAKGDRRSDSVAWNSAFHHQSVRVSQIWRGPANMGFIGSWKPSHSCKKRERGREREPRTHKKRAVNNSSFRHSRARSPFLRVEQGNRSGRFVDSGILGLLVCEGEACMTRHGRASDRPWETQRERGGP